MKAAVEGGLSAMLEQEGEQGVTLGRWQIFDSSRESLIHKEALTPGDRVCAHDRVFGDRMGRIAEVPTAIPITVVLLPFVNRRESTEHPLHPARQCLESGIHARKERVAPRRSNLNNSEDATHRRLSVT